MQPYQQVLSLWDNPVQPDPWSSMEQLLAQPPSKFPRWLDQQLSNSLAQTVAVDSSSKLTALESQAGRPYPGQAPLTAVLAARFLGTPLLELLSRETPTSLLALDLSRLVKQEVLLEPLFYQELARALEPYKLLPLQDLLPSNFLRQMGPADNSYKQTEAESQVGKLSEQSIQELLRKLRGSRVPVQQSPVTRMPQWRMVPLPWDSLQQQDL